MLFEKARGLQIGLDRRHCPAQFGPILPVARIAKRAELCGIETDLSKIIDWIISFLMVSLHLLAPFQFSKAPCEFADFLFQQADGHIACVLLPFCCQLRLQVQQPGTHLLYLAWVLITGSFNASCHLFVEVESCTRNRWWRRGRTNRNPLLLLGEILDQLYGQVGWLCGTCALIDGDFPSGTRVRSGSDWYAPGVCQYHRESCP